jgi:outer membrane autotransporter protein
MARYLIAAKVVNIEPLVGIRYFKSDATSFTESGAGSVNLRGSVKDFTSLRSALGATFSRELAGKRGPIVLEARLAWEHEFKDRSARLDARFSGASGSNFEARGVEIDRDSALVGLGMRAQVDRNATLMASYAGRFNADIQAHQFSAAVRWEW